MTCRRNAAQIQSRPVRLRPNRGVGTAELELARFYASGVNPGQEGTTSTMDVSFGLDDVHWGLVFLRVHFEPHPPDENEEPNWDVAVQLLSNQRRRHDNSSGGVSSTLTHNTILHVAQTRGYVSDSEPSKDVVAIVPTGNMASWLFQPSEQLRVYQDQIDYGGVWRGSAWGVEAAIAPEQTILRMMGVSTNAT